MNLYDIFLRGSTAALAKFAVDSEILPELRTMLKTRNMDRATALTKQLEPIPQAPIWRPGAEEPTPAPAWYLDRDKVHHKPNVLRGGLPLGTIGGGQEGIFAQTAHPDFGIGGEKWHSPLGMSTEKALDAKVHLHSMQDPAINPILGVSHPANRGVPAIHHFPVLDNEWLPTSKAWPTLTPGLREHYRRTMEHVINRAREERLLNVTDLLENHGNSMYNPKTEQFRVIDAAPFPVGQEGAALKAKVGRGFEPHAELERLRGMAAAYRDPRD